MVASEQLKPLCRPARMQNSDRDHVDSQSTASFANDKSRPGVIRGSTPGYSDRRIGSVGRPFERDCYRHSSIGHTVRNNGHQQWTSTMDMARKSLEYPNSTDARASTYHSRACSVSWSKRERISLYTREPLLYSYGTPLQLECCANYTRLCFTHREEREKTTMKPQENPTAMSDRYECSSHSDKR